MSLLYFKRGQFWSWFLSCWYSNHARWFYPLWLPHWPTIFLFELHPQTYWKSSIVACSSPRLTWFADWMCSFTILPSLPKIAFALRTCSPDFIYPALTAFDNLIRKALSNWSWSKVSLPSSLGGTNLCQAVLHAPACLHVYWLSLPISSSCIWDLRISILLPHFSSLSHPCTWLYLGWSEFSDIDLPPHQRSLSLAIDLSIQFSIGVHFWYSFSGTRPIHCYPSCWWLAEHHPFFCFGATYVWLGI